MLRKTGWKVLAGVGLALLILLVAPGSTGRASAQPVPQVADSQDVPTDQIIVKYKGSSKAFAAPDQPAQMTRLNQAGGQTFTYLRSLVGHANVLKLPAALPLERVQQIAQLIASLPEVQYAEADQRAFAVLSPNDTYYVAGNQWDLNDPTGGINAPAAWDISTGSASVVVADVDTGITGHADLVSRLVSGAVATSGYDFVSNTLVANDGGGRDSNPSDPGDWVSQSDINSNPGTFSGCPVGNSSWHGTHTAGTIGALGNNGLGVAGINWSSPLLIVRVLGKCGGYFSDIIDGISWASGIHVSGVPDNSHPAKVINLSLGGSGTCSSSMQAAVTAVNNQGTVLVVAAGNSNANVSGFTPANCSGVIAVAATNRAGSRSYYSNYGASVKISAPGGEQSYANDPNGILSTLNTGTTVPGSDTYIYYQGTSMATPHVTGVVSLMFSVNPGLTPAQVLAILQSTARAFPGGSNCNTSTCGAGILDAGAAVAAAQGLNSTYSLTVTPAGTGSGTVSSNPAGINCGATCSHNYSANTSVILSASANVGSSFSGWSGSGCSGTGTCTVLMSATMAVTATFAMAPNQTLTVTPAGTGTGTVSSNPAGIDCGATCAFAFAYNTPVVLTATPTSPSTFGGWSGEGCSGTGTCSVSMSAARNVTATFNPPGNQTLTVTPAGTGSGTVSSNPAGINCGATCAFAFAYNTPVVLTASPTTPSTFGGWSGAGCSGTGTCSVTMSAARNVTATFNPPGNQTLTVSKSGTGSGTVSSNPAGINCGATCAFAFAYNTSVVLTATPTAPSTFGGWSGEGCSGTGTCSVTMSAARNVTATFNPPGDQTLTVSKAGTGSGTVSSNPAGINCGATCAFAFAYNTSVVLTATADPGSVLTGWSGAGCSGTGTCSISMSSAQAVTATFRPVFASTTVGLYSNGYFYLRNSNSQGVADLTFSYGPATGFTPLAGDWNGDGTETVGIYSNGYFYLRNSNSQGVADLTFSFGPTTGFIPVVGDWNGDGIDTIGVYSNGNFYLRNSNSPGPADLTFAYGPATGFTPLVGDWDNNGTDTIGVYSNGVFYLRNSNSPGPANLTFSYGPATGFTPLVGDWDNNGTDTVGLYSNGYFYLRNTNSQGVADLTFSYGPATGYKPIVGDWNGTP